MDLAERHLAVGGGQGQADESSVGVGRLLTPAPPEVNMLKKCLNLHEANQNI